jgi:hypothetical protein
LKSPTSTKVLSQTAREPDPALFVRDSDPAEEVNGEIERTSRLYR